MAHMLRKNLPDNEVYNSQTGALIFMCGLVFKISSLPGIVAQHFGSSTLWAYLAMTICELTSLAFMFAFNRADGDTFLRTSNSRAYRVFCFVCSIYLTSKGAFYFCFAATYIARELFAGIAPMLIFAVFLIPVTYVGAKGIRTLTRCCEVFVLPVFMLIVFNLIFIKTDMDFGRNLPIFSMEPNNFFATVPMFGLWLGDILPLAFVRIRKKRLPYNTIGIGTAAILLNVIALLGVTIYGDALEHVSNLLIRISGFNQLSLEIGRMEWTNIFCVLTMAVFSLSFFYWGAHTAFERAAKTSLPMKIAYPLILLIVVIALPSTQLATNFVVGEFGYAMFASALFLPIGLFTTLAIGRRHMRAIYKSIHLEYQPFPPSPQPQPDSLADNILVGKKLSAMQNGTTLPNGMIEPPANGGTA